MQLHIANRSSFMMILGLFSGLWQTEKRVFTQDDPEPDWDKLRGDYTHHEQKADAKWARARLRRLAYEAEAFRTKKNKILRPRSIVGKMRLGYDEALNIKSGNDATSSGLIRNNRLRKRRRPPNLEEMELAAYYAEPSYVVLRRPKGNYHWRW